MAIESEVEFSFRYVLKIIALIILLPYHLLDLLFHPPKFSEKVKLYFEPWEAMLRWLFQPKATMLLVIANVVVFLLAAFYFSEDQLAGWVFTPSMLFSLDLLPMVGSWFLHANLTHLAGNMLALLVFGRIVEREYGSARLLLFYFGAAVIASVVNALATYLIFGSNIGSVGASGAISGLVTIALLADPFYFTYLMGIPLPVILIGWLYIYADVFAVISPAVGDQVAHFAHLGGYLAVGLLYLGLERDRREKVIKGVWINAAFLVLVVVMGLWLGIVP